MLRPGQAGGQVSCQSEWHEQHRHGSVCRSYQMVASPQSPVARNRPEWSQARQLICTRHAYWSNRELENGMVCASQQLLHWWHCTPADIGGIILAAESDAAHLVIVLVKAGQVSAHGTLV